MSNIKYIYANFTRGACNYGNCVIDYATRRLLSYHLGPPSAEFACFSDDVPSGEYDFMIEPGCTNLTAGCGSVLETTGPLPYPIYCLAGSIWMPTPRRGILIRNRVVWRGSGIKPDLGIVRKIDEPIGVRDPFTDAILRKEGINSLYVGCPTLTLPSDGVCDDGYVLLSFGRGHVRAQIHLGKQLARKYPVLGICHQKGDSDKLVAGKWELPLIDYRGDVGLYLSYFKRAHVVVTGRLHGVLPALAYNKPVFYFGSRDTRTTILDDLGIPIHGYHDLQNPVERASNCFNRDLLVFFKDNWEQLLKKTIGRHIELGNGPLSCPGTSEALDSEGD